MATLIACLPPAYGKKRQDDIRAVRAGDAIHAASNLLTDEQRIPMKLHPHTPSGIWTARDGMQTTVVG
jgi:hypothetical protein